MSDTPEEANATTGRPAQRASTFNGSFSFNNDSSNPLNTNTGFSNALLGAVSQYQESDGHPDAHEAVRRLTVEAERGSRPLLEVAMLDADLRAYIARLTQDERRVLERPEEYRGIASQVAREVAGSWRERLRGVLPE